MRIDMMVAPLRALLAATALVGVAGAALAQDEPLPPGQQLAVDQSVDEALGVLQPLSPVGGLLSFRSLLRLPDDPFAFHGPQPFDQDPPAAQSDFNIPGQVNPRGGKGVH